MKRKTITLILALSLIFQQTGFAQVASQVNLSGILSQMKPGVAADSLRPFHLRYFSFDRFSNNFNLSFDRGSVAELNDNELNKEAQDSFKYFQIGICLPNSAFWVNLRPDNARQVIDESLARTDVGKIMLEADLQLKKDTALFTSPENPAGKEYWEKLYKKAGEIFGTENITIPTLTRPWIVPNEVIIRYTKDSAYLYKASLKVMLEQDYLKDSAVYNFKDDRMKQLNEYSSQLIRELIIPQLTREINTSGRYAKLRQVFYALALAQWFKGHFNANDSAYSHLIDRGLLNGLTSTEAWSKDTYFESYKKSFSQGEYNIKTPVYGLTGQSIRTYFSGGIGVQNAAATAVALPAGPLGDRVPDPALLSATTTGDGSVKLNDDSRGWDGLPNDTYTPGILQALTDKNFAAVKVNNDGVVEQEDFNLYMQGSSPKGPGMLIPVSKREQKVKLSRQQLDNLYAAIQATGLGHPLYSTEITIIIIPGQPAHYGIRREQIYLAVEDLDNPLLLREKLYHEFKERNDVVEGLAREGAAERLREFESRPWEPITGRLANEIARLARKSHDQLKAERPKIDAGGELIAAAGYEGRPNEDYNADINPALRPDRKFAFSRKVTIPYARDNAVYRTAAGRRNVKQEMQKVLDEVQEKVLTVVFGKDFEGGSQVTKRGSADANLGWTDMIREQHPDGLRYLLKQEELTQIGIPALMRGDYATYIRCMREYAETRTNTSKEWLSLVLAARRGEIGLPAWVYARAKNIEDNPKEYANFIALFKEFDKFAATNGAEGIDPDTYDLYAPGEIEKAIKASEAFYQRTGKAVGVFPLGAGGFGTVCGVAGESREAVEQFLKELGVPQLITPEEAAAGKTGLITTDAEALVSGTGKYATGRHSLAFWTAAKADVDGVIFKGLDDLNQAPVLDEKALSLQAPADLPWVLVNQNTLEIVPLKDNEDVGNGMGPEWVVAKNWDLSFDWKTYFRVDKPLLDKVNLDFINERIHKNGFDGVFPKLWAWAKANNKKIFISAPARWLDTLGSSWDLKDFRLEGTPEGNLKLNMLPACNAIPSEYRLEIEVSMIDDPNVVEYAALQYFKDVYRVNPNKVIYVEKAGEIPDGFDGLAFLKHPNPQQAARGIWMLKGKERDLPALFARLFGITGGVRFTCRKMSFVPMQGGMESSNIFTDSVAAIFNMLSGANFSVAEISHISLEAQINECNNITGNQGADAAWAGAGLHIYMGGLYDMEAKRNFAAVRSASNIASQVDLAYEGQKHPVWGVIRYNVPVEQQAIQLSREQLGAFKAARAMLPEPVQEALDEDNTTIFLRFSEGTTAHRSLGRNQIELDIDLLQPGREKDLALRLWHEVTEKQMIIFALANLHLMQTFEKTELNPRQRETTLVTVAGQQVALSRVIDNISTAIHEQLVKPQLQLQYIPTLGDLFAKGVQPFDFIKYNLSCYLAQSASPANFLAEKNITQEQLNDAAFRINLTLVALRGTDVSMVRVPVKLDDINPEFAPAQWDVKRFLLGGLPVPGNDRLGPPINTGGIDFRYINMATQAQLVKIRDNFKMPELSALKSIDLVSEKQELENMMQAGILPSSQRMMEFISASYVRNPEAPDALECLVNYFRAQEDAGVETAAEFKVFLSVIESDKLSV